jgi:hypothetical protein
MVWWVDCSATCWQLAGESSEGSRRPWPEQAAPERYLPSCSSWRSPDAGHQEPRPAGRCRVTRKQRWVKTGAAVPVTGTRLSALIAGPVGFYRRPVEILRFRRAGPGDSHAVGCQPAGHQLRQLIDGDQLCRPGDTGYAVKQFTRSDGTTLTVIVNLYRHGGGASVFDANRALHNRCTHFTYRDADGLRYQVDIKAAAPAGLGDRSRTYDATETSRGELFPTEITFI